MLLLGYKKSQTIPLKLISTSRLFQTLKDDFFTGFTHFILSQKEYLIFWEEGDIKGVIEEFNNERRIIPFDLLKNLEEEGELEILEYDLQKAYIFYSLLSLPLVESGRAGSFEVGHKLLKIKNKKQHCILEIIEKDKKSGIYIWEGKVIVNTLSPQIFEKDVPVLFFLYMPRSGEKLKEEIPHYEEVIQELSKILRKEKINFEEEFLWFIHNNVSEECEVIDPFLGVIYIQNGKININLSEEENFHKILSCLKKFLELFVEDVQKKLSPSSKSDLDKVLFKIKLLKEV